MAITRSYQNFVDLSPRTQKNFRNIIGGFRLSRKIFSESGHVQYFKNNLLNSLQNWRFRVLSKLIWTCKHANLRNFLLIVQTNKYQCSLGRHRSFIYRAVGAGPSPAPRRSGAGRPLTSAETYRNSTVRKVPSLTRRILP